MSTEEDADKGRPEVDEKDESEGRSSGDDAPDRGVMVFHNWEGSLHEVAGPFLSVAVADKWIAEDFNAEKLLDGKGVEIADLVVLRVYRTFRVKTEVVRRNVIL